MTEIDEKRPAFPCPNGVDPASPRAGLTAREYAAIQLCVPDSGTEWLDQMISRTVAIEAEDPHRWRSMDDAPRDGTIINAVARYPNATAGYPRYIGWRDDLKNWIEHSKNEPEIVIPWAWRPRGEWPQEGDL